MRWNEVVLVVPGINNFVVLWCSAIGEFFLCLIFSELSRRLVRVHLFGFKNSI